jgi:uncharacterized protein (TIGR00251 family)
MLDQFKEKFNQAGEVYLRIKARPGASATSLKQVLADSDGQIIKIDIAAPAVKGRANQALIKFLAGEFAASKNNIKIISGAGERMKLVKIVK